MLSNFIEKKMKKKCVKKFIFVKNSFYWKKFIFVEKFCENALIWCSLSSYPSFLPQRFFIFVVSQCLLFYVFSFVEFTSVINVVIVLKYSCCFECLGRFPKHVVSNNFFFVFVAFNVFWFLLFAFICLL